MEAVKHGRIGSTVSSTRVLGRGSRVQECTRSGGFRRIETSNMSRCIPRAIYANSSTSRIRSFMNQMVMHTAKSPRGSLKRTPKRKLQTDIAHVHVARPKVQLKDSPISPNIDSEEEENQPVTSAKPPCERSQPGTPLIEKSRPKSAAAISDIDLDDANSPASITKMYPTFTKPRELRKKQPDFVLEVSLAGPNEFSLIYETDIPL